MATAAVPSNAELQGSGDGSMKLTETKRGKVYVGELSPEFLRIPAPVVTNRASAATGQDHALAQQQMLAQQVAVATAHRLIVTVIEAKLNKNYGMTKMDTYCRLRIGHAVYETPTAASGGKSPYWGKTVQSVVNPDLKSFDIEIFDERAFSNDSRIAHAKIKVADNVKKGSSEDEWYPLSGKLGDEKEGLIHLQISWKKEQRHVYPQMMMPQMMPQMMSPMMMPGTGYVVPPGVNMPAAGAFPPQPQCPAITEEDLKQMKEMFPAIDNDVIKSVLEASNGNKDAAINSLLAMQC